MRYVVSPSLVAIAVAFLAGAGAFANENPADSPQASSTPAKPAATAPATPPAPATESPPVLSAEEMMPPVAKQEPAPKQEQSSGKADEETLAVAASVKGTVNKEGKICYREKILGTRMYKETCKTKEELEATAAAAQDAMRVMRSTAGSERGN
jgi:hypothetical protein